VKTSEAAKGRWSEIFEYYGLPPVTGKNHFKGECPVCGARGKYRVDDRDGSGSWICVCGSGDGMSLLVKTQGRVSAQSARKWIRSLVTITATKRFRYTAQPPDYASVPSVSLQSWRRYEALRVLVICNTVELPDSPQMPSGSAISSVTQVRSIRRFMRLPRMTRVNCVTCTARYWRANIRHPRRKCQTPEIHAGRELS
jgi:hypothetical protein